MVEAFIGANSGGTRLGKSDPLFSLLSARWEVADEKMDDLLGALNAHGFGFDRDFVLKTCLVLLGEGARYEVQKFRRWVSAIRSRRNGTQSQRSHQGGPRLGTWEDLHSVRRQGTAVLFGAHTADLHPVSSPRIVE